MPSVQTAASMNIDWQGQPGTYVLFLQLDNILNVEVRRLGSSRLLPGLYGYVGSALGPGGVRGRLMHHLRANKRHHWHIDQLSANAAILGVGIAYSTVRSECRWTQALLGIQGVEAPVKGFGSTDCKAGCYSHLLRLPDCFPWSWVETELIRCPIHWI